MPAPVLMRPVVHFTSAPPRLVVARALALALLAVLVAAPPFARAAAQGRARGGDAACTLSGDLLRAPVDSQRRATPPASAVAPAESTGVQPALVVYAAVRARSVRFAARPEIRVRLCGALDSVRVLARENLPTPVVAGTTYQNVYVAVQILGRLNAECLADRITGQRPASPSNSARACASLSIVTPRSAPRDSLRR